MFNILNMKRNNRGDTRKLRVYTFIISSCNLSSFTDLTI